MIVIISYLVPAAKLNVGDRVLERRFNSSNQSVEKSYRVAAVSVGRFVHYTIEDEQGLSLRTASPETIVEVPGADFEGEAY